MTREEHLQWTKNRALAYLDDNDPLQAVASMMSDLNKHPKLANHPGIMLGLISTQSTHEARRLIEGFN